MKAYITERRENVEVTTIKQVSVPDKVVIELSREEATMLQDVVGSLSATYWFENSPTYKAIAQAGGWNRWSSFEYMLYSQLSDKLKEFSILEKPV